MQFNRHPNPLKKIIALRIVVLIVCFLWPLGFPRSAVAAEKTIKILNVSYDPTRELYSEVNQAFGVLWRKETGQRIIFYQSHGGSGKQGRAIIDGLDADVATLALAYDTNQLYRKGGLIPENWQARLPGNSAPYTSTIVFLVRKGNPKNVRDWDDLARPGISLITPNPKTSGGARWNYLAAWAYAENRWHGDEVLMKDFMKQLFQNVAVLDAGARGATTTFVERQMGDVLLTWENEAYLAQKEIPQSDVEIVTPSVSVLAEPAVTVVDKIAQKHGTQQAATAYLRFLYSEEGQDIIGRHFYRPRSEAALQKYSHQFQKLKLVTVAEFGGWDAVQQKHFSDGAIFDTFYEA